MMTAPGALGALHAFRHDLYGCVLRRRDAVFDLIDALLTSDAVSSPVHLSLAATHRRGWGSLYAALAHGRFDVAALRALLARHPLADGPPVYAVDCSTWPRCDAETSPERGCYYRSSAACRHMTLLDLL
jgi:DDE superfamily endonuclease